MRKLLSGSVLTIITISCLSLTLCSTQKGEIDKINGVNFVSTRSAINSNHIIPIKEVNANYLAAIPYSFTRGNSPEVFFDTEGQWYGETIDGTINIIQEAKKKGLKTMIKPHIWVRGQGWAGEFELSNEDDWLKWEKQFDNYILTYAKLADSLNVELFCMATEFRMVVRKRPQYWENLIDKIRKVYKGKLTYAANWDNYTAVTFWDKLDYIGIDAYFPLLHETTPSTESLEEAWKPVKDSLHYLSKKYNRPILFTEYGYQSVDFGAGKHWEIDHSNSVVNQETQKNAYEALYKAFWGEDWFAGGFLWKWFPNHESAGGVNNKRFTPQNKSVQQVIKEYYNPNK